jgi:hypothetical protein
MEVPDWKSELQWNLEQMSDEQPATLPEPPEHHATRGVAGVHTS